MESNFIRVCEYNKDMGVYWKRGVLSMPLEQYQDAISSGRKLLACPFCDPLGYSLPETVSKWK